MIDISIVIVSYNSVSYIKNCLESIFNQNYVEFEVFLIDNGSVDQTVESVKSDYPQVIITKNDVNKGFSFACNQGIRIASGRYILTLNTDVILDKNFLNEIKKSAENSAENVGMISPKILMADDRKRIDSTGLLLSRSRRFFDRGRGQLDTGQYDKKNRIFGPCAAAALYKRQMLEDIKNGEEYFDTDFFMLIEDFDLAWRAKNSGWLAIYAPEPRCYHIRNLSALKTKYVQYLSFRNRYLLIAKNDNIAGILKNILFILPYDILKAPYFIITNEYAMRAFGELLSTLPKMLKKRRYFSHHLKFTSRKVSK